jgi:hypothetical protein
MAKLHRNYFSFAGYVAVGVLFFLIAEFIEKTWLYSVVSGIPGTLTLDEWLGRFKLNAIIVTASATAIGIVWHALSMFVIKVNNWRASDKRALWLALALVPVIAVVYVFLFRALPGDHGPGWALLFYVINGLLCYWLATALFSPSSYKYTPWLSRRMRHW